MSRLLIVRLIRFINVYMYARMYEEDVHLYIPAGTPYVQYLRIEKNILVGTCSFYYERCNKVALFYVYISKLSAV